MSMHEPLKAVRLECGPTHLTIIFHEGSRISYPRCLKESLVCRYRECGGVRENIVPVQEGVVK